VQPDVVIGLGGYVTFPGGLMGVLAGKPLVLHEQNSVAGMANKVLARMATRIFSAYPHALPKAEWVGNPLRAEFLQQPAPAQRFAGRTGPLRLLVLGGSLGAQGLNDVVPQALALMPADQRPQVLHQSGSLHIEALRALYARLGVQGQLTPFIDGTAQAMADADLLVCRAGASTVTEIAAVGAAAVFVPFPYAVDDHQTHNARFLVEAGAAVLVQQRDLTPESLQKIIMKSERNMLMQQAQSAKKMQKTEAVNQMVAACEQLAGVRA
jgi:UDP-N-acetylglucosamine--N-acetylmuramyl-(pentapeptide) pyrophosphoryl-undecaprenol N-acetylglucosamine transferase